MHDESNISGGDNMDWYIEFRGSCIVNAPTKEDAERIFWDNCFMEFDYCDIDCSSLQINEFEATDHV